LSTGILGEIIFAVGIFKDHEQLILHFSLRGIDYQVVRSNVDIVILSDLSTYFSLF
jgi:hypothetical protein